jgi:hypothetical protein
MAQASSPEQNNKMQLCRAGQRSSNMHACSTGMCSMMHATMRHKQHCKQHHAHAHQSGTATATELLPGGTQMGHLELPRTAHHAACVCRPLHAKHQLYNPPNLQRSVTNNSTTVEPRLGQLLADALLLCRSQQMKLSQQLQHQSKHV